jgi:hypothetical protein
MSKKDEVMDFNSGDEGWDFNEDEKVKGNWYKHQNYGDKLVGILIDKYEVPPKEQFPTSIVLVIKKSDGEEVMWSHKKYQDEKNGKLTLSKIAQAFKNINPMEDNVTYKVGIEYTGEGDKQPGKFPPKFYEPYIRVMPKGTEYYGKKD